MKEQRKDIVLDFTNQVDLDTTFKLAEGYDLYTGAIDSGYQRRAALENNENILRELKNQGITKVTFKDHTPMMSSRTEDFEIVL